MVAADVESVLACMLPDSPYREAVQMLLQLQPGDFAYDAKLNYLALDPDAEMPVLEENETSDGVDIVWLVTLKTDFKQKYAGDQFRIGATVKPVEGKWLIDTITPDIDD